MTVFIWASVFSLFGFSYFLYGKKQEHSIAFYGGITLMIFPYFVSNLFIMIPVGVVLVILPFVIRL
jgi:hypothetical protein